MAVVYECGECGERTLERRCPDCNLFTRRLAPGGHCPACDELITMIEITEDDQEPSISYTGKLTSSHGAVLLAAVEAARAYIDAENERRTGSPRPTCSTGPRPIPTRPAATEHTSSPRSTRSRAGSGSPTASCSHPKRPGRWC